MRRVEIGAALIASTTLLGIADAAVLRVPEDYPSILAAVDAAVSGDSVMVGPGTWTDKATRVVPIGGIGKTFTCAAFLHGGVTVIGAGPDLTTVDMQESGTGFVTPFILANDAGEAALEGMTITGAAGAAQGGSGIFGDTSGRLIVRDCHVSGNDAPKSGGGIVLDECDLLLEDSEVSFNFGLVYTAGVDADYCEVQVLRTRFEGNQGRAIEVKNMNTDTIVVQDCEFIGNRMTISGAACSIEDPSTVQVERNLFLRNVNTVNAGAGLWVLSSFGTINDNTFAYDSTYGGYYGAGLFMSNYLGNVVGNTFVGCHVDAPYTGSAVVFGSLSSVTTFENNLVVGCTGGGAVWVQAGETPDVSCNGFWNNAGGLGDYVPDSTDLFLDPQFCDPAALDFTLARSSPYTSTNNLTCGQIGALGEGCGPVSIESSSWGRIKQMYR